MRRGVISFIVSMMLVTNLVFGFDLMQWLNSIWNPTSYGCTSSPCSFSVNVQLTCGDMGWTQTSTESYNLAQPRTWYGDGTTPTHNVYYDTCNADKCEVKVPRMWFKDYVFDRDPEKCWYTYKDANGNERRFEYSSPSSGYDTITYYRGQTVTLYGYQCQYKAGFGQGYHKDDSSTATCLLPTGCYYAGVYGVTVTIYRYTWNSKNSVSNTITLDIPPGWTYQSCSVTAGNGFSKCYCSKISNNQIRVSCYFTDSLKSQAKTKCLGKPSSTSFGSASASVSVSYKTCIDECSPGQTKCEGFYYYTCEKGADGCYHWSSGRIVKGKCGVECLSDADCPQGSYCSNYKCVAIPVTTTTTPVLKCYSDGKEYDLGARICQDDYVVECQQVDSKADWRIVEDCYMLGLKCVDGKCVSPEKTEIKCVMDSEEYNVGERACQGDIVVECGEDGNWVEIEDCSLKGMKCDDGMCVEKVAPSPAPSPAPTPSPGAPTTISPPPVKPKREIPIGVIIAVGAIAVTTIAYVLLGGV